MVGGVPGGGNGAMFRARSENDADLHAKELASRGGRRRRSRREWAAAAVFFVMIMVGWGLYELIA